MTKSVQLDDRNLKHDRVHLATFIATALSVAAFIAGAYLTHTIYNEVQDVKKELDSEMQLFKVGSFWKTAKMHKIISSGHVR